MSVQPESQVDLNKVNQELLQRLSNITANYEGQLISLKVQAEQIIDQLNEKIADLEKQLADKGE